MKTNLLYLFTRTPLHVGAGSSVGAVDQPVQRERHTGFPIIPGSSIKGVLRDFLNVSESGDLVFGEEAKSKDDSGRAGGIGFGEARLLLFPVRSAKGGYALATCPLALARYARDKALALQLPESPEEGQCLANKKVTIKGSTSGCVLEEYSFATTGDFPGDWADELSQQLNDPVLQNAKEHLVLLSDDDFSHFALNACQVQQHVKIDRKTGTAAAADGALFNEETVPAEALFYALVTDLSRDEAQAVAVAETVETLSTENLIQFGGNATTGLGFCTTKLS